MVVLPRQAKRDQERAVKARQAKEERDRKRQELKNLRKQRYKDMKQRHSATGGFRGTYLQQHERSVVLVPAEEVEAWMGLVQSKLGTAYELICGLFDEVQGLHSLCGSSDVEGRGNSTGPLENEACPQDILDRYIGHLDRMYFDLISVPLPDGQLPEYFVEDVTGWQQDTQMCCAVLTGLKEVLFLLSPVNTLDKDSLESILFAVGSILSSLQMSDDGVPLDLVSWEGGLARCESTVQVVRAQRHTVASPGRRDASGKGVPSFSPIRPAGARGGEGMGAVVWSTVCIASGINCCGVLRCYYDRIP